MSDTCWEILGADISHWAPWCRFFGTSDGKYFIVDADLLEPPSWIETVIRRRTAILYCTENGGVTDLNADHEFPPMTTPEDAIAALGYTLTDPVTVQPEPEPQGTPMTPEQIAQIQQSERDTE